MPGAETEHEVLGMGEGPVVWLKWPLGSNHQQAELWKTLVITGKRSRSLSSMVEINIPSCMMFKEEQI